MKILFILILVIITLVIISFDCDDPALFDSIAYDRLPLQQIVNVQVLSINKIQVDLSYIILNDSNLCSESFRIIDENGTDIEVISILWEESTPRTIILETDFLSDITTYTLSIYNLKSDETKFLLAQGISFNFITTEFVDHENPVLLFYCIKSDEDHIKT